MKGGPGPGIAIATAFGEGLLEKFRWTVSLNIHSAKQLGPRGGLRAQKYAAAVCVILGTPLLELELQEPFTEDSMCLPCNYPR